MTLALRRECLPVQAGRRTDRYASSTPFPASRDRLKGLFGRPEHTGRAPGGQRGASCRHRPVRIVPPDVCWVGVSRTRKVRLTMGPEWIVVGIIAVAL